MRITLAETFVAPTRAGRLDVVTALDRLGVTELPLGDEAPTRLARLRVEVGCEVTEGVVGLLFLRLEFDPDRRQLTIGVDDEEERPRWRRS